MLWVKSFHLVFVIAWFSGMFYLPRFFVHHAMLNPVTDRAIGEQLTMMERKLYRFTSLLMVIALAFGAWLSLGYGMTGRWLHAKLALVVVAIGYHHYCGRLIKVFAAGRNTRSHRWYRWFNESIVLVLAMIVVLAVVKPF